MIDTTPIPKEELELFKFISPDINVLFDVGARTDIDYKEIKPSLICHLFEPAPEFFAILSAKVQEGNLKDVYLNNYGLSDMIGSFHYNSNLQTFRDMNPIAQYPLLPVRTLSWYVRNNNIQKIDFLKSDTEGWDIRVILGAKDHWNIIKYYQYEHWNNDKLFHELLSNDFEIEYIGRRNSLCMSKTLLTLERRQEVIKFIRDNKFGELS